MIRIKKRTAKLLTVLLGFTLVVMTPSMANAVVPKTISPKADVHGGGNSGATGSCKSGGVASSTKWKDWTKNIVGSDKECSGYNTTIPSDVKRCTNNTILILWLTSAYNNHWFNPARGDHLDDFNAEIKWANKHYAAGSVTNTAARWAYDWLNGTNYLGQNPKKTTHYKRGVTVVCVTTADLGQSATYCKDYFDYPSTYIIERKGKNGHSAQWVRNPNTSANTQVTTAKQKADSTAAYRICGIQCPTTKSSSETSANHWIRSGREGDNIPAWADNGTNYTFNQRLSDDNYYFADSNKNLNLSSDSATGSRNRGYFCYWRGDDNVPETEARTSTTSEVPLLDGDTNGDGQITAEDQWLDTYNWTGITGEKVNDASSELVPGANLSGTVVGEGAGPNKFVSDESDYNRRDAYYNIVFDKTLTTAQKKAQLTSLAQKAWSPSTSYNLKDASNPKAALNLEALAEGGVLNVLYKKVQSKPVKVTYQPETHSRDHLTHWLFDYTRTKTGTMSSVGEIGGWSAWTASAPSWDEVDAWDSAPITAGKWQTLANHCNDTGFAGATSTNATRIDSGDYSLSGTATSDLLPANANPRWGYSVGTRQSLFDKECAFDGTQAAGSTPDDGFISLFRNNEPRPVFPNKFVPTTAGLVKYDGGDAITSSVTRWVAGTPNVAGLSNGGNFRLLANGTDAWSTDTTSALTERNWSGEDTYSRKTAGKVEGDPTWQAAANWASSDAAPQVLVYSWEYTPLVGIKLPTLVGFDKDGNKVAANVEKVDAGGQAFAGASDGRIEGRVFSKNVGTTSPALKTLVRDNSGSGTTNTLDGNLDKFAGLGWGTTKPNEFSGLYHVINFVRSTTE